MGVKNLLLVAFIIFLLSSCSADKTKPVITDVGKEPISQAKQKPVIANVEKEKPAETKEDKTIEEAPEQETEEEPDETEEAPEQEINETEEEPEEIGETEEEPETSQPNIHTVMIKDLKLEPQQLTINKGDTVVWKHEDEWEREGKTKHMISRVNLFRSPLLYYGDTFNYTFNQTGQFSYIDVIYKDKDYMRGTIIVE